MSNLYQDAILDAKALRASAIANAKAALEEAFEPKIQEMLRLKLSEELDELEEEAEEMDEVKHEEMEETIQEKEHDAVEEDYDINEAELEEILSQLEEMSQKDEAYDKQEESLNEAEEEEGEEEEGEKEEESKEEEVADDETKVVELTLGDLKQVLQSIMDNKPEMADMSADEMDSDTESEAEISLEEILAELEAEGVEDAAHRDPSYAAGHQMPEDGLEEEKDEEAKKMEEELEKAKATIDELRQDLQEVNLLNAKYLYMNKLFKSKSLTESQKVKVINALDRASSVSEVKNTYETLKESFETKKSQLKESIGFASQAAGIAPKGNIVDADPFVSRWKTLAGIK